MFIAKASGVEKISNMLNQWQIQGKKIETAPPLSQGVDERPLTPPPSPPAYLKVWIRH